MDKKTIQDFLNLLRAEFNKVVQSIEESNKTSQEAILSLKKEDRTDEVVEAIGKLDKEEVEEENTELLEALGVINESISNIDNEVNVEATKLDTKAIEDKLSQVSNDIKGLRFPESVDNHDVLVEIANRIQKTDLSKIESLLAGLKIDFPTRIDVDLDPNLIEDKRVKVKLPEEQVAKMSQMIDSGSANGANLSAKLDGLRRVLKEGTDRLKYTITDGGINGLTRNGIGGNRLNLGVGDGLTDIWNGAGDRTPLSVATQLYHSSTDAGDDALIANVGLDANGDTAVAIGFVTGQTQSPLSLPLKDIYNQGALSGSYNGKIYTAEFTDLTAGVPDDDTKVQLVMLAGFGIGAIANFPVPNGSNGLVGNLSIDVPDGKSVKIYLAFQDSNGARIINPAFFQNGIFRPFDPTFTVPANNNIMFLAETSDTNVNVSVLAELVLRDNSVDLYD